MQRAGEALLAALGAASDEAIPALPPVMVVAAHPDDETVGAASRLPRLAGAHFLYVTDGAPRDGRDAAKHGQSPEGYAQLRRGELQSALALCGIDFQQVLQLGCPDQQASLRLAQLAREVAQAMSEFGAQAVLTQPYEGGHPDHDATAFAVHAGAALLRSGGRAAPEIVEMSSYHMGPQGLRAGEFLPDAAVDGATVVVRLDPQEQQRKRAVLACFVTQQQTLAQVPLDQERFRPAPRYDFTQPPHAGRLFYEAHDWGMTGERFRRLAAQALAELELDRGS
jgi:N-acetylglucosamine malate deacetylase 2